MKELNCKTSDIKQLTEQIYQIRIQPVDDALFTFKGGQYLYLLMPDGKRIPLSIASPPEEKSFLELHIRLIPGHQLAADMLRLFQSATKVLVEGPYGKCFLRNTNKDLVIIAGGTGFSPMKSLLESAFNQLGQQKISLYLGAQTAAELYQSKLIDAWNTGKVEFNYVPVISDNNDTNWQGRVGFPHQIAITDLQGLLQNKDFYISGSEAMVLNVYQELLNAGVEKQAIFSDILDIKREMGDTL